MNSIVKRLKATLAASEDAVNTGMKAAIKKNKVLSANLKEALDAFTKRWCTEDGLREEAKDVKTDTAEAVEKKLTADFSCFKKYFKADSETSKVLASIPEKATYRVTAAGDDAEVGDRVKVIDEFYSGLEGVIVGLNPYKIKLKNGKVIQTNLWYNMEESRTKQMALSLNRWQVAIYQAIKPTTESCKVASVSDEAILIIVDRLSINEKAQLLMRNFHLTMTIEHISSNRMLVSFMPQPEL